MQCADYVVRGDWKDMSEERPGWIPGGEYEVAHILRVHPYAKVFFEDVLEKEMAGHPDSVFVAYRPSKFGPASDDIVFMRRGKPHAKGHVHVSLNESGARVSGDGVEDGPAGVETFGLMGADFTRRLFEVLNVLKSRGCDECDYPRPRTSDEVDCGKGCIHTQWISWHEYVAKGRECLEDVIDDELFERRERTEQVIKDLMGVVSRQALAAGNPDEAITKKSLDDGGYVEGGGIVRPVNLVDTPKRLAREFTTPDLHYRLDDWRREQAWREAVVFEWIDKGCDTRRREWPVEGPKGG